jgi:hypothetical protein
MRLIVLNFLLRPISRGKFGQNRPTTCTATASSYCDRPRRSPLPPPAPGLPRKFRRLHPGCHLRVKWTVRPRYCGCQVTNPTSCILRLLRRTKPVNIWLPERLWRRANYRPETAWRKRKKHNHSRSAASQIFRPNSKGDTNPDRRANRFPNSSPRPKHIQRPFSVQVCGRLWIGRKSGVEMASDAADLSR